MATFEPLANVDAAWLGMEDPANLMMVSGIMTFAQPLDIERLRQVVRRRLLRFNRFRQRVIQPTVPLAPAYWADDPHFDLSAHIHRVALPAPGDQETLQAFVSDLMSTPLDYSKPLWQIHVIEGFDGGGALLVRIHHCIADGMALVFVLLSLTDLTDDVSSPEVETAVSEMARSSANGLWPGGAVDAWRQRSASLGTFARRLARRVVLEGLETVIDPDRPRALAEEGMEHAYAAGRLVLRSADPITPFKGALGVSKKAAWSRPIALSEVKQIRKGLEGTVNDVLITAMTGGLRRYMIERGSEVEGVEFRAAVPVNLRRPDEMGTLGNKFGLVFLSLPVGIEDPRARLAVVRRRMIALKSSHEATVSYGILNAIGLMPGNLQDRVVGMFATKATAVMTNVPGPPMPLYLAGQKIEQLMFWVPQSGRVALGISILSYAGQVFLGVATDAGLVPDPQQIIQGFHVEHATMLKLAVP